MIMYRCPKIKEKRISYLNKVVLGGGSINTRITTYSPGSIPSGAVVSYAGLKSYLYNSGNTKILYIPEEAEVYANEDCVTMFSQCNGEPMNNYYNTIFGLLNYSKVVNGYYMFARVGGSYIVNWAGLNNNGNIVKMPNLVNAYEMFERDYKMIYPIVISQNINNAHSMYLNCNSLNIKKVVFEGGSTRLDCTYMFANCGFTSGGSIVLPARISRCPYMFLGSGVSNIYINTNSQSGHSKSNFAFMIPLNTNASRSARINIFCNDLNLLNGNRTSNSIFGNNVTWSVTTNGYYNAKTNVYLYNNYSGSL